ncbi:unnamed protein product [Prunus brigantina]
MPAFVKVSRGMRQKKQPTVPLMKLQPPRRKPKKRLKTLSNKSIDIEQLKALVHRTLEPRCWSHRPESSEFAASSSMHDSECTTGK